MRTGVRVYPSSRDVAGGKGVFHSHAGLDRYSCSRSPSSPAAARRWAVHFRSTTRSTRRPTCVGSSDPPIRRATGPDSKKSTESLRCPARYAGLFLSDLDLGIPCPRNRSLRIQLPQLSVHASCGTKTALRAAGTADGAAQKSPTVVRECTRAASSSPEHLSCNAARGAVELALPRASTHKLAPDVCVRGIAGACA